MSKCPWCGKKRVYLEKHYKKCLPYQLGRLGDTLVPPGYILPHGGPIPVGWALCDGRKLSKQTYSTLYKSLGGAYGEDATSFNLPELRGSFLKSTVSGSNSLITYIIKL